MTAKRVEGERNVIKANDDVIDLLTGVAPGTILDTIRARRPEARAHAQASYLALFAPEDPGGISLPERFAIGVFVSGLHRQDEIAAFYASGLAGCGGTSVIQESVATAIADATAQGPYGKYPTGPLSRENQAGPLYRVDPKTGHRLGLRLTAAFQHVHLLVFHPRDAAAADLQALLDAGWSITDIVTLSQIVAFLTFQIRVVAGLHVIAGCVPGGQS